MKMPAKLLRLLRPKSIAVIGGGAWCTQVISQAQRFGFDGEIWAVHPKINSLSGVKTVKSVKELPSPPDAAFVGINRHASIGVIADLAAIDAGGAVCFASGYAEAKGEDAEAAKLQLALVAAAGDMPLLGPNCYGFINALDRALVWPDQHGLDHVDSGVAILTQSSNIAINLTMQQRALPIAYVVTCGNMAQTTQAELARTLLDDPRVTAIGLHIEGFGDLRNWETLAATAHEKGIPIVALKVGASKQAQRATISHTASLAGSDEGATALLDRLGFARVHSLPVLLETLKLLHVQGPLPSRNIASISCSGGEASMIADLALDQHIEFPPLSAQQRQHLAEALGPMVALSNPLDYHTYVWRNTAAMTKAWAAMTGPDIAMTLSIVDYPTTDPTDWECATQAAINVRRQTGAPFGVVATLPELMPFAIAKHLLSRGVVPFMGLQESLVAIAAATRVTPPHPGPIQLPHQRDGAVTLEEHTAKAALSEFGLSIPKQFSPDSELPDLCVVKGIGLDHKSDAGAVLTGVTPPQIDQAIRTVGTGPVLIEEMITDGVVELLIGITCDPAHGFVLTLGSGGVMAEVLADTSTLMIPAGRHDMRKALASLRCAPLLAGFRGRPPTNIDSILDAIEAIQAYVLANAATICEVEVNPLICTPHTAVAVDALIRKASDEPS